MLFRSKLVGIPIQFDLQKGNSIKRAPPLLGENSAEILKEFGWSSSDIEGLENRGVIKQLRS